MTRRRWRSRARRSARRHSRCGHSRHSQQRQEIERGGPGMSALNELSRLSRNVFIGGEFRKSGAASLLDVGDPATEDKIGEIADTPDAEVAAAISAANKAQKAWNAKNSLTRAELLHEAAHKIRAMKPVLGEMMTRERSEERRVGK